MPPPLKDPKGYYRILGVSSRADTATIRQAYRKRAFALHPDRNDSPNAVAEFQRLQDAYHTLIDPAARAAYDTPVVPRTGGLTMMRQPAPTAARRLTPRTCQSCGKVTAQPRYVILEKTTGRLWRCEQQSISGVFCRRCADRLAFLATLHCWILGWWALPMGPFHTLVALAINLKGGLKPRRENSLLLLEQAQAFLAQGKRDLAFELAMQSRALGRTAREREPAERLINALGGADMPSRRLRNAWTGLGRGFWTQLLPPTVLAVAGFFILLPWIRPDTLPGAREAQPHTLPPIPGPPGGAATYYSGARIFIVAVPRVALRSGPGAQYEPTLMVDQGTFLIVMDMDQGTGWARVLTAQGVMGFVPFGLLRPVAAPPGGGGTGTAEGAPDAGLAPIAPATPTGPLPPGAKPPAQGGRLDTGR